METLCSSEPLYPAARLHGVITWKATKFICSDFHTDAYSHGCWCAPKPYSHVHTQYVIIQEDAWFLVFVLAYLTFCSSAVLLVQHRWLLRLGWCGKERPWIILRRSWLRHYATSRKVAGSSPEEVDFFSSIYLILPAALWPWGRLSL
jgi:hypothetical protein